ncbi:hypothetical protein JM18_007931 [Phytophthora kernoviae]|uniref:Pentacotripeptide-repeat region of PRORP domain-containing protein n=1 Tax=Phytophthora kernoviae TaxID=325452 RepID=A0A921V438_9STRA|nr:hypothetical protein JM18_007931 [Phytophthora kernoviae]
MERAQEIVTGWMLRHVDPAMPGQDATVMVMVADAMQDHEFVMKVYTCLRDAGVSPSPLTLEYTAAACAQLGHWRTALEVIEFMHQAVEIMQPSLDIYENAIVSCHVAKKWMRAKHLLEEMRSYGLEASPELHVASIKLCIDSGETTATRVLLQSFLDVYDEDFDLEEKQETLTELFHAAVDAKSLPQARFFREQMLARDFAISKEIYTQLIQLCAIQRQWYQGRVLLAQFVDINARPPKAAPSNLYTDDALYLLDEMHTQDFETPLSVHNAALRNFGQISLFADASRVFADMRERRVAPDATSFAAMMCSCGTRVEESESFFDELKRENCEPSLDVAHAYLLAPSRAEEWEEVLRRYTILREESLFKDLQLEADVRIQAQVAVAYGRLRRSEEMLRVFTTMKVKGMEPNLWVYGEALFAYIRQGQWRHTLMLFDHLFQHQTSEMQEKRTLENFSMLWDAAVLACVRGEQTERAAVLYDTIVQQRVPISPFTGERLIRLLTNVPSDTLWQSFKPMTRLHRSLDKSHSNPRVMNAVLMRIVEENDDALAEQIVADGESELKLVLNSMTYALMLRLYANQENQASFHWWWCKMEEAKVKMTVFMFRALMYQLKTLSLDCEDPAYLADIARFLQHDLPEISISAEGSADGTDIKQIAAELGRTTLDTMEDEQRVRKLLIGIVQDLPSDLSEDALAAYCASNDGTQALLLLRNLLATGYPLTDEHVVFFLTNSYTVEDSTSEFENSRPRSKNGVIVDMAALLLENEAVTMEAGCMSFLIRQIVELSNWQQRDAFEASTQEEIHVMKLMLVRAFSNFSAPQVTEFLSKVVDEHDLVHVQSVIAELQNEHDDE